MIDARDIAVGRNRRRATIWLALVTLALASLSLIPSARAAGSAPNHPTNYLLVRGIDRVDGNVIGIDWTYGFPRQSSDWGGTWSGNKGLPGNTGYTTFGKVVRFKGFLYVISKDASAGLFGVYRTLPAPGNEQFNWSTAVVSLASGASNLNTTMNADASYLYVAEYGHPLGGPRILRSPDGSNWEVVFGPDPAVSHVHAVAPDPFHPGDVWATLGDGTSKSVLRSRDYGAPGTWNVVIGSSYWQAVQISFSSERVFFAGDNGNGTVYALDRQTLQPMWASTNYHANIPVPGGTSTDSFYRNAFYGAVDPSTGVYYAGANDASSGGNTKGLFVLRSVGGAIEFLDFNTAGTEVFVAGGRVWSGSYNYPALTSSPSPSPTGTPSPSPTGTPPPSPSPSASANLSVALSDGPDPVKVGNRLTYTATIVNSGSDTAFRTTLADVLPSDVTFVSATSSQGTCAGGTSVRCAIGDVLPGVQATVKIAVKPSVVGQLLNQVTISTESADPDTSNNSSSVTTTVRK